MSVDYIRVERLQELIDDVFYYENNVEFTVDLIKQKINSVTEINAPFPDSPLHSDRINNRFDLDWYIGRVKYFVNNPEKITPITIDNFCYGNVITGNPIIVDGNHRFLACVIRGDEIIPARYSGLVSTLDYLTGDTDLIEIE